MGVRRLERLAAQGCRGRDLSTSSEQQVCGGGFPSLCHSLKPRLLYGLKLHWIHLGNENRGIPLSTHPFSWNTSELFGVYVEPQAIPLICALFYVCILEMEEAKLCPQGLSQGPGDQQWSSCALTADRKNVVGGDQKARRPSWELGFGTGEQCYCSGGRRTGNICRVIQAQYTEKQTEGPQGTRRAQDAATNQYAVWTSALHCFDELFRKSGASTLFRNSKSKILMYSSRAGSFVRLTPTHVVLATLCQLDTS